MKFIERANKTSKVSLNQNGFLYNILVATWIRKASLSSSLNLFSLSHRYADIPWCRQQPYPSRFLYKCDLEGHEHELCCKLQYHTIPCNTIQSHSIPCITVQYHPIPSNTIQSHAIPNSDLKHEHELCCKNLKIPCNTIQYYIYNTIQYHRLPCIVIQYHTIP